MALLPSYSRKGAAKNDHARALSQASYEKYFAEQEKIAKRVEMAAGQFAEERFIPKIASQLKKRNDEVLRALGIVVAYELVSKLPRNVMCIYFEEFMSRNPQITNDLYRSSCIWQATFNDRCLTIVCPYRSILTISMMDQYGGIWEKPIEKYKDLIKKF